MWDVYGMNTTVYMVFHGMNVVSSGSDFMELARQKTTAPLAVTQKLLKRIELQSILKRGSFGEGRL